MKKRGFFFVLVLALSATLAFAATEQYTDLGTAQPLEVTEEKLSDAQANTASTVTVITSEQIAAYNAESTADLIGNATGHVTIQRVRLAQPKR
jgi:vitamin B12 transporter